MLTRESLQRLSEDDLRRDVLLPLFKAMRFLDVQLWRLRSVTFTDASSFDRSRETDQDVAVPDREIVLAAHTGLRRGSLFNLRWEQIDFANRVIRIPRTKSGRPLSVPLNATALSTLQALHENRDPVSAYVFPHRSGPNAGEPVMDIKNGFHAALELAEIQDFTWHDLRHTFASWLMMRGASLRSVAELLGHASMKMTMRYARLSPAFLFAEGSLLDPPPPAPAPPPKGKKSKRARKGQRASNDDQRRSEVPYFVREVGSSGWTRSRSRRASASRGATPQDSPGSASEGEAEASGSPYWTIFATGSSAPHRPSLANS